MDAGKVWRRNTSLFRKSFGDVWKAFLANFLITPPSNGKPSKGPFFGSVALLSLKPYLTLID